MIALGIETSCDETAASVVRGGRNVLSNVIASSLRLHKKYKGIIPEIASRSHSEYISLVVAQALKEASKKAGDIDLVCVTNGPGLIGSLLVGISFAKGFSYCLKKPLIGVNHLEAHLYASFLSAVAGQAKTSRRAPAMPFIGLVVSGGHTSLFLVNSNFCFKPLGATADDAAGEAFDKAAKILGLGYPGGPAIEKLARDGNPESLRFSCKGFGDLNFSFSGIKTAVLYKAQDTRHKIQSADIAASFQKAIVEVLVEKSLLACFQNKITTVVVGGGVAANNYLRNRFKEEARLKNIDVYFPALALSLDNAAMVAGLGSQLFKRGGRSNYYLTAEPAI